MSPGTNQLPFRVASQTDFTGTPTVDLRGSMTIARIRVYDEALTSDDILAAFNAEAPSFTLAQPELTIAVDRSTGVVTLKWNAQPDRTYSVEISTDLKNWTHRAGGLTDSYVDNQTVGALVRFYRVIRE